MNLLQTASECENPNTVGEAEAGGRFNSLRFSEDRLTYCITVVDCLQQLLATIDKHSSKNNLMTYSSATGKSKVNPVRLMVYFDESHELLRIHTNDADPNFPGRRSEQHSAYQILCRAFSACVKEDLFVVYLSTNSNLSKYSPYQEIMWSYRTAEGDYKPDELQAPIVELPFDTFARVEEDTVTLEEVSQPGHMVQFGRPL